MNKYYLAILLVLVTAIVTTLTSIYKKKVLLDYGIINFSSTNFWTQIITDYRIFLILGLMGFVFLLNLFVFSNLPVNKIIFIQWAVTIPLFLLTAFVSHFYLNETINVTQYKGIALLILSTIIGLGGIYYYI